MKILIVDDQFDNLYMLGSLLEGHGHSVIKAANGEEALTLLRRETVDLVISDVLMPGMDGFTLCREIRKDPSLAGIPFITYTATYTGQKDEDFAREIGSDDFIVKPCEPEELIARIDALMTRRQSGQPAAQPSSLEESEVLQLYNERLVRKLEKKMLETEREVLARNEALEALRRSEEILNTTQKITRIGGWQYDLKSGQTYWTRELYHLHDLDPDIGGMDPQQLASFSISCYAPHCRQLVTQAFELCKVTGQPYDMECAFTSAQGREMIVSLTGKAIMEEGKVVKVYGAVQDITSLKEAEREQARLRTQLMQAQKLESIGRLAGGVAHDFNNILTVINGYSEEVLKSLVPGSQEYEDTEQILKAGHKATALVKQLLTFSRRQPGKTQPTNLNRCLEDIISMLTRLLGETVNIRLDLEPKLDQVMADTGQLEQILINLAVNAKDAMPQGGTLKFQTRNLDSTDPIYASYPDVPRISYVILRVSDTGIGMNSFTMEHLFEPFFSTKDEKNGTGLGLATVYGIVNQYQGYIRVESEPGEGVCFTILLPALQAEASSGHKDPASVAPSGDQELIMVVEDDHSIRDMTSRLIRKLGFEVISAGSAMEAIRLYTEDNLKPAVLITDYIMAGMNGLELAEQLRQINPELRIILMSGYIEKLSPTQDRNFQDIPFMQKPFTQAELAEKIKQALGKP